VAKAAKTTYGKGEKAMAFEKVKNFFDSIGLGDRLIVLPQSTATVKLAAEAIGCHEKQIAKSLALLVQDKPVLVLAAGNVKLDNKKFKETFNQRPHMIPWDRVEEYKGHEPGGVCPFVVKPDVEIYLDVSLKQNEILYPAGGSENSVVKLTLEELEKYTRYKQWVDVCKELA